MLNPKLIKIAQTFPRMRIRDVAGTTYRALRDSQRAIPPGARIAIAVGSRGIANIDRIVKATVKWVNDGGGEPFIIPAMGSHGGATALGQIAVLEGYGISEATMGAPIKSSLEVVELPMGEAPNRVFMDKYAFEADGAVLINRIKPHTDFHGPLESGIIKMCVIGLGKHRQALEIHSFGVQGLRERILPTARQVLKQDKIILGVGIVENAYDETAMIKVINPLDFETMEAVLIKKARANMPYLPIGEIDILVIDEMGKDISGVGIDPNITGRVGIRGESDSDYPKIKNIIVCDLTVASQGNAIGMGLADFVTRRFYDKVDLQKTYENVLTSTFFERGKIPIIAKDDRQSLEFALRGCGQTSPEKAKIVRIKNTLKLDELYVSQTVLDEIRAANGIRITGEWVRLFTETGKLEKF